MMEDIRQLHLEQFYNELSNKGLKYGTIKLLNVLISSSFELAVDNDYIRKNPAKRALSKLQNDKTDKMPLSADEVKRLLISRIGLSILISSCFIRTMEMVADFISVDQRQKPVQE